MKPQKPFKEDFTAFQFVYMALAIDITDGHGPSSEAHCELLVKKPENVCSSRSKNV